MASLPNVGLPKDIPAETVRAVAEALGVSIISDTNGSPAWTIHVRSQVDGLLNSQNAAYEASTKTWILQRKDLPSSNQTGHTIFPPSPRSGSYSRHPPASPLGTMESNDWVEVLPKEAHTDFFRSVLWSETSLGSLETWPRSLRFYTSTLMAQRSPAAIFWGANHIAIYNENFIPLIGTQHPRFMGKLFNDEWPDLRDKFDPLFEQLERTRAGIELKDFSLFMQRHNYVEETWWQGNLFPLIQDNSSYGGCTFMWTETTRQVLSDRRTKLLNDLGHFDMSTQSVWDHILKVLGSDGRDIAMAIMYSAAQADSDEVLKFEGAIGVKRNHLAAPERMDLNSQKGFAPQLRIARDKPSDWLFIERDNANFQPEVLDGIDWQGYGEASKDIIIIPIEVVNNLLKGFVILGLNPRRFFDSDHRQFVDNLHRQLITVMNSVTTAQQAKKREAKLSHDLAASERRIRTMAELAPSGMYDLSAKGGLVWANRHFFALVGCKRPEKLDDFAWQDVIHDDDQERCSTAIVKCLMEGLEISDTIRLKRRWQPPAPPNGTLNTEGEPVWVFYQAYPHKEDGTVSSIMGCMTDVTQFKWAESLQARSAEEAQIARARQEEFIDIVSHELRNPLSAITQSADDVIQSLQEYRNMKNINTVEKILNSNIEAAESILLCAGHQRRIVDDVLTLSKLDSALISVVPSAFRPDSIHDEAMRMFQAEFASNHIKIHTNSNYSGTRAHNNIICDSARVMQVFVNLLTNAIKFTKTEEKREINISYGTGASPPDIAKFGPNFQWNRTSKISHNDPTGNPDYGKGDRLYLYFAVQDTGQGLRSDKAVRIFDKFIQASRRTHIKYGGSGLGLYISRELVEIQGGCIGVGSEEGVGSTFAFYIKARKSTVPEDPSRVQLPRARVSSTTNTQAPAYEVLLVEDNLLNQKVLTKQLRKAGCTVHVANHGGEAIDFLLMMHGALPEYNQTALAPMVDRLDCILMDWEMPVLDGLAATKRLRVLETEKVIQQGQLIIGVTANARSEQIQVAMDAGMDAVVVKPFRVPELLSKIGRLLDEREGDILERTKSPG